MWGTNWVLILSFPLRSRVGGCQILVKKADLGLNVFPIYMDSRGVLRGGGGKIFLESSSVLAPYMTGTFGKVVGPRNHTGSEPRPARK